MKQDFDLIIIGAGPGGYEVAAGQAAKGRRVALIEKASPGGTCLNRGCIPTKCLCASASMIESLRDADKYGIEVEGIKPSYARAVERMNGIVASLRDNVRSALKNCEFVEGEARFNSDGTVSVGDAIFSAPQILISTGSEPARLNIPGAELAMTSDDFLRQTELPASLTIIGGGVIGMEFAGIAAAYGVQVTVIEYCKEILPPFDAEVAKRLRSMLSRRGISFALGARVTEIRKTDAGYEVDYEDKKGIHTSSADAVLMAVGRRPVVPRGLSEAGIEVDSRGFIVTDGKMQTTRPGVYAVGDCNGRMMLAHAATAQARVALGENIELDVVPAAVFTSPEVAMVGLTAERCKMLGVDYSTSKALFGANGKAQASGHPEGFVKVIYQPGTRRLLGCHIIGPHAADLIQEAALGMVARMTVDEVGLRTIHGHPTLGEVVMQAMQPS